MPTACMLIVLVLPPLATIALVYFTRNKPCWARIFAPAAPWLASSISSPWFLAVACFPIVLVGAISCLLRRWAGHATLLACGLILVVTLLLSGAMQIEDYETNGFSIYAWLPFLLIGVPVGTLGFAAFRGRARPRVLRALSTIIAAVFASFLIVPASFLVFGMAKVGHLDSYTLYALERGLGGGRRKWVSSAPDLIHCVADDRRVRIVCYRDFGDGMFETDLRGHFEVRLSLRELDARIAERCRMIEGGRRTGNVIADCWGNPIQVHSSVVEYGDKEFLLVQIAALNDEWTLVRTHVYGDVF